MQAIRRTVLAAILASGFSNLAHAATWAVGPQYDTTHVYVPAADFDRLSPVSSRPSAARHPNKACSR